MWWTLYLPKHLKVRGDEDNLQVWYVSEGLSMLFQLHKYMCFRSNFHDVAFIDMYIVRYKDEFFAFSLMRLVTELLLWLYIIRKCNLITKAQKRKERKGIVMVLRPPTEGEMLPSQQEAGNLG